MKNEEIIIAINDLKADDVDPRDRKWGFVDTSILMDRARSDENEKIIGGIEKWLKSNSFFSHDYRDDVVDLSNLQTKLNELRNGLYNIDTGK